MQVRPYGGFKKKENYLTRPGYFDFLYSERFSRMVAGIVFKS